MSEISVVILAAGLGTRMKSDTPKVMFNISGVSMIRHVLARAYELTNDVSVVLFHQKELIEKHILDEFKDTKIYTQDLKNYPAPPEL